MLTFARIENVSFYTMSSSAKMGVFCMIHKVNLIFYMASKNGVMQIKITKFWHHYHRMFKIAFIGNELSRS